MAARLDGSERVDPAELRVVLTPMRRRHLRAVVRIENQVQPRPWSMGLFLGELTMASSRSYVVARVGGLVVGYAGVLTALDDGHITTVAVDPAWQRAGIGSRLVACVMQEAIALGAEQLTLEVRASNVAAQRLYQRFGFAPAGMREGYYVDPPEDAMIMWAHGVATPAYATRLDGVTSVLPGTSEFVGFEGP